jgi:beta-ribofuranosylaminobenzene 5'-phosphate synthase
MEAFSAQSPRASEAHISPHSATVTTTARLHFGFLDPSGRSPRPFGSFGLSLDRPRTQLTLKRADTFAISGPESERATRYLRAIAASCGVGRAYAIEIEEAIPAHAGLGSGTQLALAAGFGFAAVEGLDLSPQEIASRLGRGARSGIGIATFEAGGAVLDSGPVEGALPHLVGRVPFPAAWHVLLIFDPHSKGLDGASEAAAFETLPDFSDVETAELRERILQRALPALTAGDFGTFCAEVGFLQDCMGAYFSPLQGGPCTSPRVAGALHWLRSEGVIGLGQSSWGPTGFAFVESLEYGEALLAAARARTQHEGLQFDLAQGRNEGAIIQTSAQGIG